MSQQPTTIEANTLPVLPHTQLTRMLARVQVTLQLLTIEHSHCAFAGLSLAARLSDGTVLTGSMCVFAIQLQCHAEVKQRQT